MKYEFIDKALYFPEEKALAIADLHIGYEESLNEQGIFVPRRQFEETMADLEKVFSNVGKVKEVVIVGDLKHEFGIISSQEWSEVRKVLDYLKGKVGKVVLVKGNHDTVLEPIAKREEVEIKECYKKKDICFVHGDKLVMECMDKSIRLVVAGHRHPAVILQDEYKKERYKCFLVGKWKGKKIIVLPSFFPFVEGSEISSIEDNRMFIEEKNLKGFEAWVVGDEVYRFGKIKDIV